MTTTERSGTPRTDAFFAERQRVLEVYRYANDKLLHIAVGDMVKAAVEFSKDFERELTALRLRYTWKPMKDAPRDRQVLIHYPAGRLRHEKIELGYINKYSIADGWMEMP